MTTLQIVFVALPAALILVWLFLAARGPRQADVPNAVAVLRHGGVLRTLTLALAVLLPMVMIYAIAVFPWSRDARLLHPRFPWGTDSLLICAGAAYLATCLVAGLAFIEVSRAVVCLTEEGIIRFSPWQGRVTLNWNEIETIRYSRLNSVFVVSGSGRKIRVSRYFVGVKAFADMVKRRLPTERFRTAQTALDAL